MLPEPFYIENQVEIEWSMRYILMDWLVEVHHAFSLPLETLFLCVNYVDRFLSEKVISLDKLQLVGITALLIAAKYNGNKFPSIPKLVHYCEGCYTVKDFVNAEKFMLNTLEFDLGWPGPLGFLRMSCLDLKLRTLVEYLLEATIMDERFVGSRPSLVAASAYCLAKYMLGMNGWVSVLNNSNFRTRFTNTSV